MSRLSLPGLGELKEQAFDLKISDIFVYRP